MPTAQHSAIAGFRPDVPSLISPISTVSRSILERQAPSFVSLADEQVIGHLMGMFELNNLSISIRGPATSWVESVMQAETGEWTDSGATVTLSELECQVLGALIGRGLESLECDGTGFFALHSCLNHSCDPNVDAKMMRWGEGAGDEGRMRQGDQEHPRQDDPSKEVGGSREARRESAAGRQKEGGVVGSLGEGERGEKGEEGRESDVDAEAGTSAARVAFRALREIEEGAEVLVSYIDETLDPSERARSLMDYGFECRCPRCMAGA